MVLFCPSLYRCQKFTYSETGNVQKETLFPCKYDSKRFHIPLNINIESALLPGIPFLTDGDSTKIRYTVYYCILQIFLSVFFWDG